MQVKRRDKGTALISALFIMTLVAIVATAMSTRLQLDIYRTRLTINGDKLNLASQAVAFWALTEISAPKLKFTHSDNSGKLADFPKKLQGIYPDATIDGALYDLQGRFNLNDVSDKKYQFTFQELLKNIAAKLEQNQRNALTASLISWISPYQPGQADVDLSYYLKQKPPYYPAHQFMVNISEFRLLSGVSAKLYLSLKDYLTTLPEVTPININTASKPVLMSLGMGLTGSQVDELIAARGKKGIQDLTKINPLLEKLHIRSEQVTIESKYYLSISNVHTENLSLTRYSVLKREKDKQGKITVSLISEGLNSFE
ncbi:Type II secretory pathway, component PulK [Legionella massiliensis]|uniref:Type II secretion system protein K n=1 Tax=Legionella massiliensis TaxID=1034943 RepID=A0A078KZR4_9GAMM|nr:type II secretion system minor pseudopilin GspK [Legionella massiliensis]CDZ78396.1 Type II secretory pathway, component PulK [Legionella massiliensis]CEE14134.1 General secretion pathway protein K [Legionella massiliensis]